MRFILPSMKKSNRFPSVLVGRKLIPWLRVRRLQLSLFLSPLLCSAPSLPPPFYACTRTRTDGRTDHFPIFSSKSGREEERWRERERERERRESRHRTGSNASSVLPGNCSSKSLSIGPIGYLGFVREWKMDGSEGGH